VALLLLPLLLLLLVLPTVARRGGGGITSKTVRTVIRLESLRCCGLLGKGPGCLERLAT